MTTLKEPMECSCYFSMIANEGDATIYVEKSAYDALKAKLASAESVIESFLKKTDVYMRLYPDDKELYRYRDEARDYLKSEGGG